MGGVDRQRKGLEWGNSNYLLGTKGLEKLHLKSCEYNSPFSLSKAGI